MINKRRDEEQWRSNGILEFFTDDQVAFRTMLWGPSATFVGPPGQEYGVMCDQNDPDVEVAPW